MTKFTDEMITKAKKAKNAEELMAIAKENGIELNLDEAAAKFAALNEAAGEVADEELDNVSGGGCGGGGSDSDKPKPKFNIGDTVYYVWATHELKRLYTSGVVNERKYENGTWYYRLILTSTDKFFPEYDLSSSVTY